jgi:hypothetical protein
LDYN